MALTDRMTRLAKAADKDFKLSDSDGLYLYVSKTGVKSWRYDYRLHGKRKTFTVGRYPSVPLVEARRARDNAKTLVGQGVDPTGSRREELSERERESVNSFEVLANEYVEVLREQGRAPATIGKNEWVRDLLLPDLGTKLVAEIKTTDILVPLRKIERSGRYETAQRARNFVSNVFRLAILSERASVDPTYPLRGALRTPLVQHHHAIVREDVLGKLLLDIEGYKGAPSVQLGLKFLSLVFVRPGELRFAKWDEFDLRGRVWRIPAERMKMRRPHDVPLSNQAHKLIHSMRKHTRQDSFVFPTPRFLRKEMSENGWTSALWRLGYKGEHTPHGFRSTASTILNERGYRADVIEMQLAHFDGGSRGNSVRKIYNRALYWDDRVKMMQEWADLLDDLRSGATE